MQIQIPVFFLVHFSLISSDLNIIDFDAERLLWKLDSLVFTFLFSLFPFYTTYFILFTLFLCSDWPCFCMPHLYVRIFSHFDLIDSLALFLLSLNSYKTHSLFLKPSVYSFLNITDVIIYNFHVLLRLIIFYLFFLFSDSQCLMPLDKTIPDYWPNWRKNSTIMCS